MAKGLCLLPVASSGAAMQGLDAWHGGACCNGRQTPGNRPSSWVSLASTTELHKKPFVLMPALSTSCCGGACNQAGATSASTGAGVDAEGEESGVIVGAPEGFRLIDMSLLNGFLQTEVVCRQCAEASVVVRAYPGHVGHS